MTRKILAGCCGAVLIALTGLNVQAYARSTYEQDYDCLVKYRTANSLDQVSQDCQKRAPAVVRMLDKQVDQAYDQVHDYQRKLDTECRVDHKDPDQIRLKTTKKSFLDGITDKFPHL